MGNLTMGDNDEAIIQLFISIIHDPFLAKVASLVERLILPKY